MRAVSLDDKYALEEGQIFLSGVQSIVRLALDQKRRDARAGLRTAGFISGYRGSPLGGLDTALWQASKTLAAHDIRFEPGLNEELAATAVSGTQQAQMFGSRFDGVFGIWYAKNPGVDRAMDALKHANALGTSARGGVLAISGDDPGATSSSLPNQCEQAFIAALIPTLSPTDLAEIIAFGQIGFALSRYSGLWVGLKTVADTVESTASIGVAPDQPNIVTPNDFEMPPEGLSLRWPEDRWSQDERLLKFRLPAARAFARANGIDRIAWAHQPHPRLVIVASGKAYGDVRAALDALGIDEALARELGIAVFKVGLVWPLESERISAAVEGARDVLVVEERRAIIEPQLKDLAYHWPADRRPSIVGKADERGAPLCPESGELSARTVALAIAKRIERTVAPNGLPPHVIERLRSLEAQESRAAATASGLALARLPHFCPGCPHARSTRLPEGSLAMAGIGCHALRVWMPESQTLFIPQMGGEGASWIGIAPFVETGHVFQNMGDGTYVHSGSLAVRAAVAAGAKMTFRILYNEATAMTGGQPVEGGLSVAQIAQQLATEGVKRIAVVSDDPDKYPSTKSFGAGVTIHHRDELDILQRELREWPGVSALIYDQVCATEKRRRRKRGLVPQAAVRPFINTDVCEGCGDCVDQSNCAAIMPVETVFGRKRQIDQSACNVDLSCVEGFCPSFVTIEGGDIRQKSPDLPAMRLSRPAEPVLDARCDLMICGIGGTGVITVGAILGMAAHASGNGCSVLDNTGIARKGGAVSSHVRLAKGPEDIHGSRIADLDGGVLLACDLVTATSAAVLDLVRHGCTQVIANANTTAPFNHRLSHDGHFDDSPLRKALMDAAGERQCAFVPATEMAERLMGDAIYANMIMLGYAYQQRLVPLSLEAIEAAIALNGADVEANRRAFTWGRHAAHDRTGIETLLQPFRAEETPQELDALIARHSAYLTEYQDAAYAAHYRAFVDRIRESERRVATSERLATAAARGYFRLLAIKDEYEVARLFTTLRFDKALRQQFGGGFKIRYHMAPPFLARPDPRTGRIRKITFGPRMKTVFTVLARMRRLRGTWLDVFGRTQERKMERSLIAEYERTLALVCDGLTPNNYEIAVEIAALPEQMRGYGPIKAANVARAKDREKELMQRFGDKAARAA